ncbi:hypothetical protein P3T43_002778 [Paraburkholderia sp. GAS41]
MSARCAPAAYTETVFQYDRTSRADVLHCDTEPLYD